MKFKLLYKEYDFKITWGAKVEFNRETGLDLWSTLQTALLIAMSHEGSDIELTQKIGKEVGEINAVHLLYAIAKPMNSNLKFSEISDAVNKSGWREVEEIVSEWHLPYPRILQKIGLDVDDQYSKEGIQAKKDLAPSQE